MAGGALMWLAGLLVPRVHKDAWRASWSHSRSDLETLIDRGEFPRSAPVLEAAQSRAAFADAFWLRFSRAEWNHFVHGPVVILSAATMLAIVAFILSAGFSNTRRLAGYAIGNDQLFGVFLTYAIPIVFALVTGLVFVLVRGRAFNHFGWRYNAFFAAKTIAIVVLVPVIWIELAPVIRAMRPPGEFWRLLIALISRLAFVVGFACAVGWSVSDQRRRCPVCLGRLSLPISIGSRASVFDPATTEFLCENGHGSLSMPEVETAPPDRWVKMDESWHDLFQEK